MLTNLPKLNKEQKEAVEHKDGPLLIVAGAGTGKTTVISQRIVNLISSENSKIKPDEILAVTFTEKAASEMEERVSTLLDYGYVDLWIMTFHSFCEKVLRENALDIGLSPDFKILDSAASWLLLRQNLDKFNFNYYKSLGSPNKFIQSLISHFSHCKDQEIYPENYLEYANSLVEKKDILEASEIERIKEVAEIYQKYQQIILENNCLDFGDLINYCLKLFKTRPLILNKYREKFKYILVDEFQDTNWSQYELVKLLASPKNNLTVTADDDQAIYRWRGASFSNIVQFKNDFLTAKQISLIKNYRSSQNILDLSYNFIQANNPDRLEFINKIDKKLISQSKEKGIIEYIVQENLEKETGAVIKKILEIIKKDKKTNYSDFAILARANDTLTPFIKALERSGVPFQFLASRGLYTKPIILDIISYFKLLDNYHESSAVFRILNLPFLNINPTEISEITRYSQKKTNSIFETLEELSLVSKISQPTQEKINLILSLIKKHSQMVKDSSICEIMISFLDEIGYLKYIVTNSDQEKLDLINQFYKKIKSFENEVVDSNLKKFVEEINFQLQSGDDGKLEFDLLSSPNSVKLMTIHGAKGLEFKYVFLVSMVDKRFPSIERKDPIEIPEELIKDIKPKGDMHLQEERRICYVAMTRAKKGLYFTFSYDYGGQRAKKPSQFLIQMGYKDKELSKNDTDNNLITQKNKAPIFERINPEYLPKHFSFSQLSAFEKCPLQYKFNFILKVPVKGKAAFSFGKTIHNALCEFLKQPQLTIEELNNIYKKNWINEWYETKKQKEEYLQLGKKILESFYKDFASGDSKVATVGDKLALELPFNLKINDYDLYGVIDRIDTTKDGIEIIDYKTGQSKDKLDTESKFQLLIYQIACQEVLGIEPSKLTYYYLEDNKKLSFLGTEKEKQDQKNKIIDIIEKIKNSDFKATPGWQCQYCDFKDICDFAN